MHFSYVFILKFALYMFRTDRPFIIRNLFITVHVNTGLYTNYLHFLN